MYNTYYHQNHRKSIYLYNFHNPFSFCPYWNNFYVFEWAFLRCPGCLTGTRETGGTECQVRSRLNARKHGECVKHVELDLVDDELVDEILPFIDCALFHNPIYRGIPFQTNLYANITGWWFGTWILFSYILGIIIPIDFHIFQGDSPQPPTSWSSFFQESVASLQKSPELMIGYMMIGR